MLRRISTIVAALAVGSTSLITASAATAAVGAPPAPTITNVSVSPNPVVITGSRKAAVTFSFVTGNNATEAEAYLKPPAPSVESKLNLTKRNIGPGKVQWTARTDFDRGAKAGGWSLRVTAKNSGGDKSENKTFEVRQVWETGFDGFSARPGQVRRGDTVTLSGTLRVNTPRGWKNLGGEKVHIAFRPFGGSWQRVDSTVANRDGKFVERVKVFGSGSFRAEYDGSKTTHAAKSREDRVVVKRVSLDTRIARFDVSPSKAEKGQRLSVEGVLLVEEGRGWDGLRGQRVDILFKAKGDRDWRRVASDRTDHRGRFGEKVTAETSGWFRAVFDGGRGLKGSSSRPEWVEVAKAEPADTRIVRFDAYPEPVKFGRFVKVGGKLLILDGDEWVGYGKQKVHLYFKANGKRGWKFVKTAWTSPDGRFFLQAKDWKSGWWKVVFDGNDEAKKSEARPDFVRVVRR